jgi:DnaJ-domain-containing protein 1
VPSLLQSDRLLFSAMQNHFDLFQLPQRFAIDQKALEQAFQRAEPGASDKFAHASDAEKRVAMQWATRANEAYQTLKNPLKRAATCANCTAWTCRPNPTPPWRRPS